MNKKSIIEELKRKEKFITFLRNAIFLLEDAINRNDEDNIKEYKKTAIAVIDGILGINSHGELKSEDTREEDAKLEDLKMSIRKLKKDITDKYENLPESLKPKRGWRG